MKIISAFTAIYCLLCATQVDGEIISAEGQEGGQASFRCSHKLAKKNHKYFCKDPCSKSEHTLARVKPGGEVLSGRIALRDTGDGAFNVTVFHLKLSDAGTYWCAVERSVKDTYTRVQLTVREGSQTTTTTNTETTRIVFETTHLWTPGNKIVTNYSIKETFQTETYTNISQGHKTKPQITASIVLYLIVGAIALFTALVIVLISLRKRNGKSRPQLQVCTSPLHLDQKGNCTKHIMADRICAMHESSVFFPPGDQKQSLYENVNCINNVARTKHATTTSIEHFPSYVKPLPALPGHDSDDKGTARPNAETCKATEQPLWFGLVLPQ